MVDTKTTQDKGAEPETAEEHNALVQKLTSTLQDWHARLDEMRVQIDLAELDSRADLRRQFETAQNAWLAARKQLEGVGRAGGSGIEAIRHSVDDAVRSVKAAIDAATAVVKRS
jgi:hypothetical protein